MGSYLVQDPHHPYVARFVELVRERYGHRPIGFFTDPKARYYRRNELTTPREAFVGTYELSGSLDARAFAAMVRARHPDLIGILPYSEETIDSAVELLPHLGLSWNTAEVLARFRKKAELKAFIAQSAPSIRLNVSLNVSSAQDVRALGTLLPAKFILKPEDGYGSRGVAIFTWQQLGELDAFFAHAPGRYVLEEYLDGPLYTVDGLVDAGGEVHVSTVFSSGRRTLNGCPVVYADGFLVQQDVPLFAELAAYAKAVMCATKLLRCPFHLELIVDSRGPCLVEVGARLIGHSHAFTLERLHRGSWDVFGAAAQAYFTNEHPAPIDYTAYNSVQAAKIYGASEQESIAYAVSGTREVSQLSAFDRWIVKPTVGQALHRTKDLFTVPYSLVLVSQRDAEPIADVAAQVHRLIRFNGESSVINRLVVDASALGRKVQTKVGWVATNVLRARGK